MSKVALPMVTLTSTFFPGGPSKDKSLGSFICLLLTVSTFMSNADTVSCCKFCNRWNPSLHFHTECCCKTMETMDLISSTVTFGIS